MNIKDKKSRSEKAGVLPGNQIKEKQPNISDANSNANCRYLYDLTEIINSIRETDELLLNKSSIV